MYNEPLTNHQPALQDQEQPNIVQVQSDISGGMAAPPIVDDLEVPIAIRKPQRTRKPYNRYGSDFTT